MKITMTPIVPRMRGFNVARYKAEIEAARKKVSQGILDDFKRTTATWEHKFLFGVTRRGDTYYVTTKDDIYRYVDQGTRPHPIRARNPSGRLAFFARGFRAKTRVDVIGSSAGSPADSDFRRPKEVYHPGTKARNFTKRIKEKWQKIWLAEMQAALRRAARG